MSCIDIFVHSDSVEDDEKNAALTLRMLGWIPDPKYSSKDKCLLDANYEESEVWIALHSKRLCPSDRRATICLRSGGIGRGFFPVRMSTTEVMELAALGEDEIVDYFSRYGDTIN